MDADRRWPRPSPALVISFLALAVAISGTAVALPGKNKVETNDIKKSAVTAKKLKKNAVRTKKVKNAAITGPKLAANSVDGSKIVDGAITGPKIADSAVTGAKIADGTITGADVQNNSLNDTKMSDYELVGNSYILVTATEGADEAAARAAAPEVELFTKGQGRIYAKCFRSAATNTTFAEEYAQTSADGAIMEGTDDHPGGNAAADFLNTNTLEVDRQLADEQATANDANYNEAEWALAFPDGTGLNGQDVVGAKNGNLAGGNGLYGSGNVCLFQGSILG
jgi:hypothetical protein